MKKYIKPTVHLLSVVAVIFTLMFLFIGSSIPFEPNINEELTLWTARGEKFKVLQFADLHFGEEGTVYHNADEERTLAFIDYAINTEKPDFIVLLGDNMMSQGVQGAKFITGIFDRYEIPYTFIFGNHDAELYLPSYKKSDVSKYLETCDSPYLLYKSGYVQADEENRYGNFSIALRDSITKNLLGAFVIVDTGTYDYGKNRYQSVNAGQIQWYREEIAGIDDIYGKQKANSLSTVPTITYGHMQLPEYAEAYQKAKNGDGAEFFHYEDLSDRRIGGIASNSGQENESFFAAMREMQSAKAYFCGHMHGLSYHVKMDGIILGFCPQTGVTNVGKKSIQTFSYTIDENFDIKLNLVEEPQSK